MSSSSFVDLIDDPHQTEFPFPTVENSHSRSPSDSGSDLTPPYLARSLPEHRSSTSSRHRRTRHDSRDHQDRERDHRSARDDDTTPAKLLSRLASRSDYRDSKHIRTLLVLTSEKLEGEKRRADQAEQRVIDVLHRLRAANEATALAQADASRAQQEVRLYQIQLEAAQREISRAQEIVDQVERLRREAEEEAAKARSVARKCREEMVLSRAREEGRQEGYLDGLERGRTLGFTEASTSRPSRRAPSRPPPRANGSEDMEIDVPEQPPPPRRRVESERHRDSVPSVHRAPSPPQAERHQPPPRAPSRSSRHRPPDHIPDFAQIGSGIPVPTLTTPLDPLSPSHSRPADHASLQPLHIPEPRPRSRPADPVPVPIHEAPRSPGHPQFDVLPDNFIPYARDNDASSIVLPPPHELSRPVTPVDASPVRSEAPLPVPPPGPPPTYSHSHPHRQSAPVPAPHRTEDSLGSRESIIPIEASPPGSARRIYADPARASSSSRHARGVRSRDYAYSGSRAGPSAQLYAGTAVMSPQSRTSTRISEYDIIRRPGGYRQEGERERARERERDEVVGQRTREAGIYAEPYVDPREDLSRPIYTRHGSSQSTNVGGPSGNSGSGTLSRLFRRKSSKSKSKRSSEGDQGEDAYQQGYPVPDITVESPSTDNSRPTSAGTTVVTAPHLLSPEYAPAALPQIVDSMFGISPIDSSHSHAQPEPPSYADPHSHNADNAPPVSFSSGLSSPPSHSPSRPQSPYYAEAPVPPSIVYPDVPRRTKSRMSSRSNLSAGSYANSKHVPGGSVVDSSSVSLGGRLSPLSLFK